MNISETDRLAELIGRKHTCLTDLWEIGRRQMQLIEGGEMTALLDVLAAKQRLIERLQLIERDLNPFRSQSPEDRQWRCEHARAKCSKQIEACERLLGEILEQEKEGEKELKQRRDATAARLDGAHHAGRARGAYIATDSPQAVQLDLASEI